MFYKTNIDEIYKRENVIRLSLAQIRALSPAHLALQEVRSKRDLEILGKAYNAFAPLNPRYLDFRNELHMTADKNLFIEMDCLPNYRAFRHSERSAKAQSEESQMAHKDISVSRKPQYDNKGAYDKATFESTLIRFDRTYFRLAFRAIARDTDERTLIFSLLPKDCGFGHTMYGLIPKRYILDSGQIRTQDISHTRICFALGIFNSLVVDYIARAMIQISANKTYLERIPLPQPSDDEIMSNETYRFIAKTALILQLYNDSAGHFSELAKEFGVEKSEIPKTQKLYDSLKARLDIAVAKLYGLDSNDFSHILQSFKVLQTKQPAYITLLKDLFPH